MQWRGQADSSVLIAKGNDTGNTARSVRGALHTIPPLEYHPSLEAALASPTPAPSDLKLGWIGAENSFWPFRHPSNPIDIPTRHAEALQLYQVAEQRVEKEAEDENARGMISWDTIFKGAVILAVAIGAMIAFNLYFGGFQ